MGLFGKKVNINYESGGLDDGDSSSYSDGYGDSLDMDTGSFDEEPSETFSSSGKKGKKKRKTGGGKGAGKTLIGLVGALVIIAAVGLIVTGLIGPRRGECKRLLEDFEQGCNTQNFYQVADCLNPTFRTPIKAILLVVNAVTGSDLEEIAELINQATGGALQSAAEGSSSTMAATLQTLKVSPYRYGLPGSKRVVQCKLTAGIFETYIDVTIRKKRGEVYIDGVALAK